MINLEHIQVVAYTADKKQEWNAFVAASKNGTFLFDRNFMDYHSHRFTDASVLIYHQQKLVALFPANCCDQKIYSHQGLSYGGMILSKKEKYSLGMQIFQALLKHYWQAGFQHLELKEIPSIYHKYPSDEVLHWLFLCKAKLFRRDSLSVINLQHPLFFSRDRKAGVKRGVKHKLEVKEVTAFDAFWNQILIPNLQQKHQAKPVHTLEEINLLKSRFPHTIRQFNVYYKGQIVAGTTIFETHKVAHSQYISGNADKNELGSLDFLHDYLVKKVFKNKDYFDFGISNEAHGTKVNTGLMYWKESFGARTVTQDFYSVETENYQLLNQVLL
ncbi:GNAT family N-acetyltransferase [Ochrovirga pacifica]|uniref:GNAT family N-acetyltransferase n=1 Tax=Ochrovirga pacifica TaxID=1042376 RepID=UPI000255A56D|nr:GNAT family N-acetyltransferase [Ochrovirga pacifica]